MADEASILRVAEDDLEHAVRLLTEHVKTCQAPGCEDCVSLHAHAVRAEKQVALLTPPETEEMF